MSFYWKFVDTLVYNIATISAIIVGLTQFLIRAYKENDGASKVRKGINQSLLFVNKVTSNVYELVNANALPVQDVKVTKTTKRRSA